MRDKVYSFAGCIMDGAPFLTPLPPVGNDAFGMNTEGILRLLAGDALSIEPSQLKTLGYADLWGRYNPIDPAIVKALLWTPLNDAIFLFPNAHCPDKTVYPVYNGSVDTVLGSTSSSMSRQMIFALWDRLLKVTAAIPFKAIVNYPTTHLANSAWRQRIDELTDLAVLNFDTWHEFTVRPELEPGQAYWAHFSQAAKRDLWADIGRQLIETMQ